MEIDQNISKSAGHERISPARRVEWHGWTDRGKVRPNNEDAFLGLQFDGREVHRLGRIGEASTQAADLAFAVSDGMGGALAGELASRITVEKITTLLPRTFRQSAGGLAVGHAEVLAELFDQVHRTLCYVGGSYEECFGMEATLSLCWFAPGWMHFGHIGDSRIYYLPADKEVSRKVRKVRKVEESRTDFLSMDKGGIRQLTHDDTHVGWLFRNGKINEREARTHPRRNLLQKALGGGNQFVDPQVGSVAYEPGDIFLLCTDGLVEGLYDNDLANLLRSDAPGPDDNPARRLVDESVSRSGRDNTTALVVRCAKNAKS